MRRANSKPVSAGFSIIELLMVIFIISVILSMMVPALVSGRESARRISCVNNLRQLSLALQNYETQIGALPPGVVNSKGPVSSRPEDFQIGWIVQVLPYIEQTQLAKSIDTRVSVHAPENTTCLYAQISSIACPVENTNQTLNSPAISTYAACYHDTEAPIDYGTHGMFLLNTSLRHADIYDGSSFTIFLGEKIPDSADLGWVSGSRATLRNTGAPIASSSKLRGRGESVRPPAPADDLTVGGFGSRHPGGANFAFGDGAVRFVRSTINPAVFRLLGHRADGEMLESGSF